MRQTYTDDDLRDVYLSFLQAPSRFTSMYLRTDQAVSSWLPAVRGAIAQLDPYVIVNASGALTAEDRQLAGTTFLTSMLTGFAAFTVFLALLGIYGVTASRSSSGSAKSRSVWPSGRPATPSSACS